jgi:hypothetical protein
MMIRLWTTDPPYDFRGKYWQAVVKDNVLSDIGVGKMTVPYQRPHPPIMHGPHWLRWIRPEE